MSVSYGTITITDTNDIERIYTVYAKSTTNTTAPSAAASSWTESISTAPGSGDYIWQRTVVEKSGTGELTYGDPVCVTGPEGDPGATGKGVRSLVTQYYLSTSSSSVAGGSWSATPQSYPTTGTKYYWTKTITTYTDNTTYESTAVYDVALTSSVKDARDANVTADEAKDIAQQASIDITNLQTRTKYFWTNLTAHTNGTSGWTKPDYPVGTFAASGISGTTFDYENSSTYGYNTLYSNGIKLRYNAINLGELTGTALTFYHPSTASQGAKAMELSATALKFYDATGSVAQAEFGGTQAKISGTINAYDGKIGNNNINYWYIGNYTDYNQNDSAIIKSVGTASIQLNETNTWRVATNRIHTAWAPSTGTDAFKLHFPIFNDSESNSKHWDYGLHLPTSNTDKFLYIRNAPSTQTLDNLLDDLEDSGYNYWTYQFYIDGEGNLHAGDIYSHGTLISGTSAPYLLKSGGTMTGSITMSNGGKLIGDVTGNVSGSAGKLSNTSKIGDTNKPVYFTANGVPAVISYEINKSVPSDAVFTDKNVQTTKANTTKIYLTGTQTNGTSTGTLNFDEYVYVDTIAGALHATTYNGYTLAAAAAKGVDTSMTSTSTSTNLPTTKAVADLIATYLPLVGGTISGAVDINDELYADSATFGNLIVNGGANFTNNLQANTINGVEVGNSPKFTDTVTTVTVTGNGNAITSMTASNGVITATKGSTFLTSYTETDPIFTASAAHGITSSDISNWNSKTSNTGTVTSVRVQASSPLQSSTSTAQNATLNTTISFVNQNANTVLAGPASGSTAAAPTFRTLVAADIPDISGTYYLASNPSGYTTNTGTVTKVIAGTGLSIGTTAQGNFTTSGTINHTNSVTAKTAAAQSAKTLTWGGTFTLYEEKYDAQGHVTGVASYNMTMPANPNTHNTAYLYAGKSDGTANAATTNGNTYLILMDGGTATTRRKISGSGTVDVVSDANGNITITGSAHPTSLKNPNAITLKLFNETTARATGRDTPTSSITYDGSTAGQIFEAAGKNAFTAVSATPGAGGATTFTFVKADGSTQDLQVTVTASVATGATQLTDGDGDPISTTGSTIPVWFDNGLPADVTGIAFSLLPTGTGSNQVAVGNHAHGNITNGGDITATAPTIANGDQIVINDHSASKITNGPTFDGSTTTQFLTKAGTWGTPVGTTYTAGTGLSLTNGEFSVKLGYTTSGNNRKVQADTNGNLYVVQTDTTYSAGTGLSLSNNQFSVKLGYTTSGNNRAVQADTNGNLYVVQKDTTYSAGTGLSLNNNNQFSVKLEYATSGNNRAVQVDSNGNLYVVQTDTTYSAGTGLSLSNAIFSLANNYGDTKNPYASKTMGYVLAAPSDTDGAPSFRELHEKDVKPILSKTYTGVIATANTDAAAHMYNIKVVPNTYGGQWFIKYRVRATMAGISVANGSGAEESIVYISGMRNTYAAYQTWNNVINTSYRPYYYHTARFASETAISEGHKLGISFRYAYNPATAANAREVIFEIIDYDGCEISFLDSFITFADFPSTNYSSLVTFDATTQGNTMSGDRNDVNYQNRMYYVSYKTYTATGRYKLMLTKDEQYLLPVNSIDNNLTTSKTMTTESFDPFGPIYYYSYTNRAADSNFGNDELKRQLLIDLRYSFNCGGNTSPASSILVSRKALYLVAVPQSDGKAKLDSSPLSQVLPTTDDGKIYIYLGQVYQDTDPYRIDLALHHPIYWYKNGAVRQYTQYAADAAAINGHTVGVNVPSNAVFTDTWKALSTSQAGYVAQAPNDTGKFLRGDATWAAVTKANVGLDNVENTALSTWAGSSNITTVGTISTGTWNGSTIAVNKGGTGAATFTAGAALIGNGTNAIQTRSITNVTSGAVTASTNLVTANSLVAHVSNALGNYVTIAGDNETVTGTKVFNNLLGTKYVATKGGNGCEINYNSSLEALVFSFS